MKIQYQPLKLRKDSLHIIEVANEIIEDYQSQGFNLTVRQIYYQFVARDLLPNDRKWSLKNDKWVRDPHGTKNATPNYKWLSSLLNDGRLAGLIDWNAIEDRTRFMRRTPTWDTPKDIIESCAEQFKLDLWETQKHRVEVWIEKDALIGVIEKVCKKYQVPFFSCRGYVSQSATFTAGERMKNIIDEGKTPIILHLGDHDPSGIDMTRDILERVEMFTEEKIKLKRLALNMNQVKKYKPPPNPAKITDTRCKGYIKKFGKSSWELDALEPKQIEKLIEDNIKKIMNPTPWKKRKKLQKTYREEISEIADGMDY